MLFLRNLRICAEIPHFVRESHRFDAFGSRNAKARRIFAGCSANKQRKGIIHGTGNLMMLFANLATPY